MKKKLILFTLFLSVALIFTLLSPVITKADLLEGGGGGGCTTTIHHCGDDGTCSVTETVDCTCLVDQECKAKCEAAGDECRAGCDTAYNQCTSNCETQYNNCIAECDKKGGLSSDCLDACRDSRDLCNGDCVKAKSSCYIDCAATETSCIGDCPIIEDCPPDNCVDSDCQSPSPTTTGTTSSTTEPPSPTTTGTTSSTTKPPSPTTRPPSPTTRPAPPPPPSRCHISDFELNGRTNEDQNPLLFWVNQVIIPYWLTNGDCVDCSIDCSPEGCNWQDESIGTYNFNDEIRFKITQPNLYTYTLTCWGKNKDTDKDTLQLEVRAVNLPKWREIIPVLLPFLRGLWPLSWFSKK